MSDPKKTKYQPKKVELTAGKKYQWCACGSSKNQPYCDGGHKGSPFMPKGFKAEKSGEAWLCMCKQTKNPPFCDGTHNSLVKPGKIKEHHYSNGEITIVWKPIICIHSGRCIQSLPGVYKPGQRPWIQIENATTAEILEQMKTCPSGALSFFMNKEQTDE